MARAVLVRVAWLRSGGLSVALVPMLKWWYGTPLPGPGVPPRVGSSRSTLGYSNPRGELINRLLRSYKAILAWNQTPLLVEMWWLLPVLCDSLTMLASKTYCGLTT